jgi:outer membrane immunogenic protein
MDRAIAFAAGLGFLSAIPALADGPPPPVPIGGGPVLFEAIPTWTGFYLGGTGGYGTGHFQMTVPSTFAPGTTPDPTGGLGGILFGYNQQLGFVVGGLEMDFMAGTLGTNQVFPSTVDTTSWNISTKFETLASIRGRLGVAVGPVLVYGTAGGAWANAQSDIALMDTGALLARGAAIANHLGWVGGGGVEIALSPRWIIRGEWLHYEFNGQGYHYTGQTVVQVLPQPAVPPPALPFAGDASVNAPTVDVGRAAVIFKF